MALVRWQWLKNRRWVEEDFSLYQNGLYIIQAGQGSGKTEAIKTIPKGKKVLLIGSRNQLGIQTQARCSEQIKTTHLKSAKSTKSRGELALIENLFINYSSLHKLSNYKAVEYDYLIIDEPILLWSHSTEYKPSRRNEQEFLHRIHSTPIVIFMGADMPDYMLEEIEGFVETRKKHYQHLQKDFLHIEYQYEYLKGKDFVIVHSANERDTYIENQLKKRFDTNKYKDNVIKAITDEFGVLTELPQQARGILIATEYGGAVKNIKAKWDKWCETNYPHIKPNIVAVYSENTYIYDCYLETLSNPNRHTDIDILIISTVWGVGIDIRNEFALTVGDFCRNKEMPLTWREHKHLLLRDRDVSLHVIQDRNSNPHDRYGIMFKRDIKNEEDLSQYFEDFGVKTDELYIRNPITGAVEAEDKSIINRLIRHTVGTFWDRYERSSQLIKALKKGGGTVDISREIEISKTLQPQAKATENEEILSVKAYTEEEAYNPIDFRNDARRKRYLIERDSGKSDLTQKDLDWWADGDWEENQNNKRYLDKKWWAKPKYEALEDRRDELHRAIYTIRRAIQFMEGLGMITSEQLNANPVWRDLKKNKDRFNTIIEDMSWYGCDIKTDTLNAGIKWLGELLKHYNYHTQFKKGGVIAGLEKTARQEHNPAFLRWKKEYRANNDVIGYLKYKDYLWDGLNDGTLDFNKLGKDTQKYIQTFPHLLIEEYETHNYV